MAGVPKVEARLKQDDPAYSTTDGSAPVIPYGQATLGGFKGEVPAGMTRRQWEEQQMKLTPKLLRKGRP
jgi:hypothetical protein